jgi:hypothetical protein
MNEAIRFPSRSSRCSLTRVISLSLADWPHLWQPGLSHSLDESRQFWRACTSRVRGHATALCTKGCRSG